MIRCTKCKNAIMLNAPECVYLCRLVLRPDPFDPGTDGKLHCGGYQEKGENNGKGKAAQHESD